ncbi:enamine deaminase RidA (YjgF/YER057c/UK114 family) [Rhodoligotrophos appendicifer]|uniref:hypothetical protein n=1 Tax=Rhodoligotrophos appendicifer TaxID=987056 RepID=UPI001185CF7D|nr:hypothetical protein [Rhodoligotrophos appendicifer]
MREHISFGDPWRMPIEVPYSLLVRDESLAWSCGQIPLDRDARVLSPGNLEAQTEIVCNHIATLLQRAKMPKTGLGQIVAYFVGGRDDEQRMIQQLRDRLGTQPLIVPICVPYLYLDGLLLEIDAFAGEIALATGERSTGDLQVRYCDAGEVVWMSVVTDRGNLPDARRQLDNVLADLGLIPAQRLSDRWISGYSRREDLLEIGKNLSDLQLLDDEGAVIGSADSQALVTGMLSYVRGATPHRERHELEGVRLTECRGELFTWMSARSLQDDESLVAQTADVMEQLGHVLRASGLDFGSVVKATSLYIGGSSAEELYANMRLRNRCYNKPGPASTGLPVAMFGDPASQIGVELFALRSR